MKAKVCFDCRRFFEEDFLLCPYCGKTLKTADLSEVNKVEQKREDPTPVENSSEEAVDFYYTLSRQEKLFVDKFYFRVKTVYQKLEMRNTKKYTYFHMKDEKLLKNYGRWFYFSKRDGEFSLKYRPAPDKTLEQKSITIDEKTEVEDVVNTIISVMNERYGVEKKPEKDDKYKGKKNDDKKRLTKKSDHSSVLLAGEHQDKFFGDLAEGERKTQKEVWEVKHNFNKKGL